MPATETYHEEKHPNWYYDIPVMHTLILGSFPPHADKRNYPFYYPNKQNHFWKIIAHLAGKELNHFEGKAAVEERQQLMEQTKIGVQNLGKKILRKGTSARDTDIEILAFQDIAGIVARHPELKRIILAGYSAKSSTYHAFCMYLREKGFPYEAPAKVSKGASFFCEINGMRISCIITYSTSPAAFIPLDKLKGHYLQHIPVK